MKPFDKFLSAFRRIPHPSEFRTPEAHRLTWAEKLARNDRRARHRCLLVKAGEILAAAFVGALLGFFLAWRLGLF